MLSGQSVKQLEVTCEAHAWLRAAGTVVLPPAVARPVGPHRLATLPAPTSSPTGAWLWHALRPNPRPDERFIVREHGGRVPRRICEVTPGVATLIVCVCVQQRQ